MELAAATQNQSPNQQNTGNEPAESGFFYARNRGYFTDPSRPFPPLRKTRLPLVGLLAAW
jgi:hypothetical protein